MDQVFVTFADKALLLRDRPANTHTVEELFNYPLDLNRTFRQVRLVVDDTPVASYLRVKNYLDSIDSKIADGYYHYKAISRARKIPKTWLDKFRYNLHIKLLRWGVIA